MAVVILAKEQESALSLSVSQSLGRVAAIGARGRAAAAGGRRGDRRA